MEWFNYIIKTQVFIGILYLIYILCINKKTAPFLQRLYLLLIIPISLIAPFAKVPINFTNSVQIADYNIQLPELIINNISQIGRAHV